MRYRAFLAAGVAVFFGLGLLAVTGCGGSSGTGGGGGSPTTPTVTVSANPSSITTAQGTTVTVTVSGTSGTATGSVTLTSGSYSSGAVSLNGGSAQIVITAGALATGTDTLTANYSSTSSSYNDASGTGSVTVTTVPTLITPTVTVSPNPSSITTAQSTTVTVTVSSTGNPTPTGSVTLSSGSYNSGAVALSGGSAQITIPAGSLATGGDTLTAMYTPDANSSSRYNSASGTGSVTVSALITPTVTVSPNPSSITTAQSTTVTVTVSSSGNPTPTGSVTLTGPASATLSFSVGPVSLTSGSVQITLPAGGLATGGDTLTAMYTPDANSSSTYNSTSGTGSVTVTAAPTLITPTVTVSPNPSSISTSESTTVTVTVSSTGNPTPTGSVTLTSGSYTSSAATLSGGSAPITIAAGTLSAGTDLLTAKYVPDANSSSTYNDATGSGTVTVTAPLAITSFTANANPIPLGSSSTKLTAVFTGGTGVITPGPIPVTSGNAVSVSPTTITIYTLTVTPTSGSASPITQTLTVSLDSGVTVNPSSTGIAVSDQILGLNLAAWYDVKTNASAILSAFQAAGIKSVRWPGGSWSDIYHWQTNSNCDVAPYGTTSGEPNSNDTFSNFVADIVKPASLDLALTADYGTDAACSGPGVPSEAAAWVTAAAADGVNVSHMTVGNEVYGETWEENLNLPTTDPSSVPESTNATEYAAAVSETNGYYAQIKAASSNTLVGVDVDADGLASSNSGAWDNIVLGNAKGSYDFVEYHFYPQNPKSEGGNENDTLLVQQAAQTFTSNIKTIKQELTAAGESGTPIYVGELGSVSSNPGKQSWSITQGLYAGQMLGEMMNDGISRSTWWIGFGNCNGSAGNFSSSLYGWQTFGAYNVFSDGNQDSTCDYGGNAETTIGTMSPTAIAYQLFSYVAVNGQNVLNAPVTGDTTNVRAYAATNPSGTALVLFNLNETSPQSVQVTVTGKSSSPGVTEYTYDKEMYDYTNTSCQTDPTCSVDPSHNYSTVDWVVPTPTTLGAQSLPMTVTLQPWSMNVLIIQ